MESNTEPDTKTYFSEKLNEFEKKNPVEFKQLLGEIMEWSAAVACYQSPAYAFVDTHNSLPPEKRKAFLEKVWNQGEFKTDETLGGMITAQIEYQAKQQGITPKEVIDTLFANDPESFMMLLQVPHTGINYKPGSGGAHTGAALEMICALKENRI